MSYKTIKSEIVYRGRVFDVKRDDVRFPNGKLVQMDIVQHNGAVAIVPVDADGQLIFVRQYRHATGGMLLELPAGTLENDEDPLACAQRELREEIGMAAEEFTKLGEFYLAPGYSSERIHLFLARQLRADALDGDEDEILEVERCSQKLAFEMVLNGEINDAKSLLGLFLAKLHLEEHE